MYQFLESHFFIYIYPNFLNITFFFFNTKVPCLFNVLMAEAAFTKWLDHFQTIPFNHLITSITVSLEPWFSVLLKMDFLFLVETFF